MPKPTSTQLGAVAENLVANTLMLESQGRLSPFSPQADDDGIDLLIYDKESGRALPAQIKSRTTTLKTPGTEHRGNVAHFEIRAATYRIDRYAVAILVLTGGYAIECAWVIPMRDLPDVARVTANKYVLRPNKSQSSRDRFSQFRCSSTAVLYERVLAELAMAPSY